MAHLQLILTLISLLTFHEGVLSQSKKNAGECEEWREIVRNVTQQRGLKMSCAVNQKCTGICCNGTYIASSDTIADIPVALLGSKSFEIQFNYRIVLYPCNAVPKVGVSLTIPGKNVKQPPFYLTHNQTEKLPGTHYEISSAVQADAFLFVEIYKDKASTGHVRYVNISSELKVRLKFGSFEHYPQSMKRYIISPRRIREPQCDSYDRGDLKTPCFAGVGHDRPTTATTVPPKRPGEQGGAKCQVGVHFGCPDGEYCVGKKGEKKVGSCMCIDCYMRKTNGKCEKKQSGCKDPPSVIYVPSDDKTGKSAGNPDNPTHGKPKSSTDGKNDNKSGSNKTMIIAVSCGVVGLLIVAAIAAGIVIVIRRNRIRYRNHDILLNQEDPVI